MIIRKAQVQGAVDDENRAARRGPFELLPGAANAHHVQNRSKAPCVYLIAGTRAARDVVHYEVGT